MNLEKYIKFIDWAERKIKEMEYDEALEWCRKEYKELGKKDEILEALDNAFLNVFPCNSCMQNLIKNN